MTHASLDDSCWLWWRRHVPMSMVQHVAHRQGVRACVTAICRWAAFVRAAARLVGLACDCREADSDLCAIEVDCVASGAAVRRRARTRKGGPSPGIAAYVLRDKKSACSRALNVQPSSERTALLSLLGPTACLPFNLSTLTAPDRTSPARAQTCSHQPSWRHCCC